MLQITPQMRILVAIEAVDGRKGHRFIGASFVAKHCNADLFSGCVFVFRSRSATSIRLLAYDGQGFLARPEATFERPFSLVADRERGQARSLEAYQAQLLLAAGDPDTKAAPMWRRVS